MGSQAQFHKRLGLRQPGRFEPVRLLIALHGAAGCRVPSTAGSFLQVTGADERLLNLFDPLGLQAHQRPVAVVARIAVPIVMAVPLCGMTGRVMRVMALNRLIVGFDVPVDSVLLSRMWFVLLPCSQLQCREKH